MYTFLSNQVALGFTTLIICLFGILYIALDIIAMKAAGYRSFPQSNWSSLKQYVQSFSASVLDAQDEILQNAVNEDDHARFSTRRKSTTLNDSERLINSVVFKQIDHCTDKAHRTILVLHGYGSGLAFFFTLYPHLMRQPEGLVELHAVDWLGMGASSRPAFAPPAGLSAEEARMWTENWFIDSLYEYCQINGLPRTIIVAHSFGAYLAVRFANKYPDIVEQLILISPVAVNDNPYEDVLQEITPMPAEVKPANPLPAFIIYLWQHHFTPFDFLRWSGPLGPKLCSAWTHTLPLPESVDASKVRDALHRYTYLIFSAPASSERALAHLLAAGAHARSSLMHVLPTRCPVSIIYGREDWMSTEAGRQARDSCLRRGGTCGVTVIESAGHHAYLEQSLVFNRLVVQLLGKVDQKR